MPRRVLLAILILLAAIAMLAACQQAAAPAPAPQIVKETVVVEKAVRETVVVEKAVKETVVVERKVTAPPAAAGGQIVFGITSDLATLIPIMSADATSGSVIYNLFDPLVVIDPVKLTPAPWLATSWEVVDDGKSYVFKLRDNVRFHDGKPLTADDVAYTINAILDQKNASFMRGRFVNVSGVEVMDPKTVKIKLNRVYAPFLFYLASAHIMPKHLLDGQDFKTTSFLKNPVGTGPFKFKEYRSADRVVIVANDDYWQGRPKLDQLIYRIIPDSSALLAAVKAGEIDVAGLAAENVPEVSGDPRLQVFDIPSWCFQTIGFNLNLPIFQDKKVRQAVMMAINREQMVKELHAGRGYVANSYLPRQSWAYNPDNQPVYKFDKAKAKQLLAEAGWVDTNGDGKVEKDGKTFKFTLLSSTNVTPGLNETIQKSLQDIGMDVEMQLLDWPAFLNKFIDKKEFEFITINMCVQIDPDNPNVWGCGLNAYNFCSKEFDELQKKASETLDLEKRKEIYAQMQKYLAEEVPRPILYSTNSLRVVNSRVVMGQASSANYTLGSWTLWPFEWFVTGKR